jgi:4-amino-4-deoxy-L-arabinose transferase-like glycosyltransferase
MIDSFLDCKLLSFIKSREIRILIVVGLLFRLVLSILYFNVTLFPDSDDYINLSKNLLNFDLNGYDGNRSPGYPFLIFLAFGSQKLVILYQFTLGIITSILWYKILLKLQFNTKLSLYIALLLESFLHVYFYETAILVEAFTLFFITLLFLQLANGYLDKKDWKTDVLMGFILWYLVLIKPFYIFLPFLIYGFSIIKNFNFKRIINRKIILLIFPLFTYFGWSYVNKINTGHFVSTSFFGLNLAQNCVYFSENTTPEYQWIGTIYAKYRIKNLKENDTIKKDINKHDLSMTIWYAQKELVAKKNNNFPDLSNDLGQYAIATIKKNKIPYAKQVICYSWIDFWKTSIYWNYTKFLVPFSNKFFLGFWYIQNVLLLLLKFSFLLICPFYIIKCFKTRKISFEFISVITILTTSILQALATYGTNSRFSYPFEFLMIIIVLSFIRNYFPEKYLK